MGRNRDAFESCIIDCSNGIIGCANLFEAVAFSSRGLRNGSCIDCGLNEYWMDRIGDSRILLLMDVEDL